MFAKSEEYAPYFREGLLFLPPKTITLLQQAGLDKEVAQSALRGLSLDDDQERIGEISAALEKILGKVAENPDAFEQLSSDSTQFFFGETL